MPGMKLARPCHQSLQEHLARMFVMQMNSFQGVISSSDFAFDVNCGARITADWALCITVYAPALIDISLTRIFLHLKLDLGRFSHSLSLSFVTSYSRWLF
jgi:hypothetical protein